MGEHSPCDALVPSIVAVYAVVEGVDDNAFDHRDPGVGFNEEAESAQGWERLDWVVDDKVKQECGEKRRMLSGV